MNSSEFDVIEKYFSFPAQRPDVQLAGGDDCAIVSVPENKKLLITTDTLISGVHFPKNTTPEDVAYKAVMVNLSDLAAMGATPAWLTLAISLPSIDDSWLSAFSQQIQALLSAFNISLIGGDTTRGQLSITIQAMGLCDADRILRRDQAKPGDKVYVTGYLGDAAIGLQALQQGLNDEALVACVERLNRPVARTGFAQALGQYSSCAIDISDGLAADLGHVIDASDCGASIALSSIPLSKSTQYYFQRYHENVTDWSMVLTQGDDYELCFTAAEEHAEAIGKLAQTYDLKLTAIGEITDTSRLAFYDADHQLVEFSGPGFQHF
jgi:thiamine-monophosphate kinase